MRQFKQSVVQFLIVFFTGIAVYQSIPMLESGDINWNAFWQPGIQGMLAALGIYSGRNIGTKNGLANRSTKNN